MQGKILASVMGIMASSLFLALAASGAALGGSVITDLPPVEVEDIPQEACEEPVEVTVKRTGIANPEPLKAGQPDQAMQMYPPFTYSREWDGHEEYLLAKIAQAEAGCESVQGKALVILVVLNRVQDSGFPDSIEDVIYQEGQFSPVGDGTFETAEPDVGCWEALEVVKDSQYDFSGGALYFENCADEDNWHSRNLKYLYQCGRHKFYSKGADNENHP